MTPYPTWIAGPTWVEVISPKFRSTTKETEFEVCCDRVIVPPPEVEIPVTVIPAPIIPLISFIDWPRIILDVVTPDKIVVFIPNVTELFVTAVVNPATNDAPVLMPEIIWSAKLE